MGPGPDRSSPDQARTLPPGMNLRSEISGVHLELGDHGVAQLQRLIGPAKIIAEHRGPAAAGVDRPVGRLALAHLLQAGLPVSL
jgi:hypothetical protein